MNRVCFLYYEPDYALHSKSQEILARSLESLTSLGPLHSTAILFFIFLFFYFTILVLPYIDMNPPRVYMLSQT